MEIGRRCPENCVSELGSVVEMREENGVAGGSSDMPRSPSGAIGAFFKRIRTRSKSPATKPLPLSSPQRTGRKTSAEVSSRSPRTPSKSRIRHWFSGTQKINSKETGVCNGDESSSSGPLTELRNQSQRSALSEQDLVSKTLSAQISSNPESTHALTKDRTATMPPAMLNSYYSQDCILDTKPRVPSYLRISCALNGYTNSTRPLTTTATPRGQSIVERRLEKFTSPAAALPPTPPTSSSPNTTSDVSVKDRASALNTPKQPPKLAPRRPALSPPPVPNSITHFNLEAEPVKAVPKTNGVTKQNGVSKGERKASLDVEENGEVHDGHWQRQRADAAREKLRLQAEEAHGYLQLPLPEDAENLVRVAFGKANLLMGKKFNKFYDLIEKNLNPIPNDPQPTLEGDLEGYWSIVQMEMEDIDDAFDIVYKLKALSWDASRLPSSPSLGSGSPSPRAGKPVQKRTPPTSNRPGSSEARKRLLEAKAAGRKKRQDNAHQDTIFTS